MKTFRLDETYEFFVELAKATKLVRIEIFSAVEDPQTFRTRVWLQDIYNLYPTMLNLGKNGEDLRHFHSSEHLNVEISLSVVESPEWLTGIWSESRSRFLELVRARVLSVICSNRNPI